MEFLEIRVAQHEPILGVPYDECLGNGLYGIAQPQIRFNCALHQGLLFGDVYGDAYEMRSAVAGLLDQLATRAQPDPIAVGMTHTEGVIDQSGCGISELGSESVEIDIIGMDEAVDLTEAQQRVARL